MGRSTGSRSTSLADLPVDELTVYAVALGLPIDPSAPRGEILRCIRDRQELLLGISLEAMLDIVVWARLPVRRSAGREALAKQIATITTSRYEGLTDRGMIALARLRGVTIPEPFERTVLQQSLKRAEGLWGRIRRTRRGLVGSLISRLLEGPSPQGDYQFLPDEEDDAASLRETIEDVGVVGGIAQKLRGAADQYLEQKLNEIERRIDRKLDEIDRRLGEWRDREILNRLRIIKLTLITAVIVAIISLGYDYLHDRASLIKRKTLPAAAAPETSEGTVDQGDGTTPWGIASSSG